MNRKNQILLSIAVLLTTVVVQAEKQTKTKLNFEDLNEKFHAATAVGMTSKSAHKIPDFFIQNDLINLNLLSTQIVEDLRATPTIGEFSKLTLEEVDARNSIGLSLLEKLAIPTDKGITKNQALELLKVANEHPVVGIEAFKKYDPAPPDLPNTNRHGFCFGRADFLYYELLKMGVAKDSIYKMFQIGAIFGDPNFGRPWSNHIVTIVRAKEGGWYALDPFYNELMTPTQWVAKNRGFSEKSQFKTFAYVGRPTRMYSQGGMNTAQAIADDTFPSGRDRAVYTAPDGTKSPAEANFTFKDASFKRYYSAMLEAVLSTNNSLYKDYFCKESQICK